MVVNHIQNPPPQKNMFVHVDSTPPVPTLSADRLSGILIAVARPRGRWPRCKWSTNDPLCLCLCLNLLVCFWALAWRDPHWLMIDNRTEKWLTHHLGTTHGNGYNSKKELSIIMSVSHFMSSISILRGFVPWTISPFLHVKVLYLPGRYLPGYLPS